MLRSSWMGVAMVVALGISLLGCRNDDSTAEAPIELALNWYPDAQHGGFYAALINGYYEEEGLEVVIAPGGPNVPVLEKVAQGRADFGVSNADQILLKRNQDADLVALLAPLQNSPRCIMVHRESGIDSFETLGNVTLALGPGRPFAEYLKRNAELPDVQFVNYTGSVARFVADPSYAQQGYVFSEPFVARQQGADPVCLMLSDLGFNPYTSCLFVTDRYLTANPEKVQKFVRATRRGWQAYLEDPEPINEAIHELNPEMDRESLTFATEQLRELCLPDGLSPDELGQMQLDRWEQIADQLKEIEFVDEDLTVDNAFRWVLEDESAPLE